MVRQGRWLSDNESVVSVDSLSGNAVAIGMGIVSGIYSVPSAARCSKSLRHQDFALNNICTITTPTFESFYYK